MVAFVREFVWEFGVSPGQILKDGLPIFAVEPVASFATTGAVAGVSMAFALFSALTIKLRGGAGSINNASVWFEVFRRTERKRFRLWGAARPEDMKLVRVKLKSGVIWEGVLVNADYEAGPKGRDIALAPPIQFRKQGGDWAALPSAWQRIVISEAEFEWFAIQSRTQEHMKQIRNRGIVSTSLANSGAPPASAPTPVP